MAERKRASKIEEKQDELDHTGGEDGGIPAFLRRTDFKVDKTLAKEKGK